MSGSPTGSASIAASSAPLLTSSTSCRVWVSRSSSRNSENCCCSAGRIRATGTVVQSNHGIKPFKAFMGALKVKDPVEIVIEATVPEA